MNYSRHYISINKLVECGGAQAVPATHLNSRHSSFLLLNHPNYLRILETALSHVSTPSKLPQTLRYSEGLRTGQVRSVAGTRDHPVRGHGIWASSLDPKLQGSGLKPTKSFNSKTPKMQHP